MSKVSRVPQSCLLSSSLLLPSQSPWVLLRLPFWSLLALFTSSSFLTPGKNRSSGGGRCLCFATFSSFFLQSAHLISSHLVPCLLLITCFSSCFGGALMSHQPLSKPEGVGPSSLHIHIHNNMSHKAHYSSSVFLATASKSSF